MEDLRRIETDFIARKYSEVRTKGKKWKSFFQTKISEFANKPNLKIILMPEIGENSSSCMGKDLQKRGVLRRNPNFLKCVLNLWDIINPFHLSGISEKVYKDFYVNAYEAVTDFDKEVLEEFVRTDSGIDFQENKGKSLAFCEFFDGFFEFVDSNTRSTLATEYCNFVNTLCEIAENIRWSVSLHSKKHANCANQQVYHDWMLEILRPHKPKIIPLMLRSPAEIQVSPRLLHRKTKVYVDKDNFNLRKIEKNMREKLIKKFKPEVFLSQNKLRKSKPQERKMLTFYSNYIEKISPLSSLIRTSRSRIGILEHVIDGRKGKSP